MLESFGYMNILNYQMFPRLGLLRKLYFTCDYAGEIFEWNEVFSYVKWYNLIYFLSLIIMTVAMILVQSHQNLNYRKEILHCCYHCNIRKSRNLIKLYHSTQFLQSKIFIHSHESKSWDRHIARKNLEHFLHQSVYVFVLLIFFESRAWRRCQKFAYAAYCLIFKNLCQNRKYRL